MSTALQVANSSGQLSAEDAYIQAGCPGSHKAAALQSIRKHARTLLATQQAAAAPAPTSQRKRKTECSGKASATTPGTSKRPVSAQVVVVAAAVASAGGAGGAAGGGGGGGGRIALTAILHAMRSVWQLGQ